MSNDYYYRCLTNVSLDMYLNPVEDFRTSERQKNGRAEVKEK